MAVSFGSSQNEIEFMDYIDYFDDSQVLSQVNKEYSKKMLFS